MQANVMLKYVKSMQLSDPNRQAQWSDTLPTESPLPDWLP